jgi:Concanavalin A-like lectin/glucanases superfamily
VGDSEKLIFEATRLTLAMLAGDAAPEDSARLESLMVEHPEVVTVVAEIVGQETWLAWSSKDSVDAPLDTDPPCRSQEIGEPEKQTEIRADFQHASTSGRHHAAWYATAVCVLLLAGGFGGAYLTGGLGAQSMRQVTIAPFQGWTPFSGRILNASACRWSPESVREMQGAELRQGETLNVLEGVAEVRLDWPHGAATLSIEGPSGVVLTADGGCNLSHGRVTAEVSTSGSAFNVDAPDCQVIVAETASLGVLVDGHDVEVHVFTGHATVVVPWSAGELATQSIDLVGGQSLTIREDPEGNLVVGNGVSNSKGFVSCTSMLADRLAIPPDYVRQVESLNPLLYWRFEGATEELLGSSSQFGIAAETHGRIRIRQDAGNQFLDIGAGSSGEKLTAYVVSSEPLSGDFKDGYSLEMWFKPSDVHRGVLASLVTAVQPERLASDHGMLLELGGPRASKPALEKPGKIRFMHRSPPSGDIDQGTSCFSGDNYAVRRWQHVVAVKDSQQLRLYVDGQLSEAAPDTTALTPGLRLLVGKIDEVRTYRQFVGQLDEVAFYARPLTPEEILHHYRLVRPVVEEEDEDSKSAIQQLKGV